MGKEELGPTFDEIWNEIREAKLYAGQPRSEASAHSVMLANRALQLATDSNSERFILEAWRMLAYTLTANEQYEEAIPYYARAIERLEQIGESGQAARAKLGHIAALFHTGRYDQALQVARTAEAWFEKNKDESGFARLCTNIANLYHRLDDHMQAYRYHLMAVETFTKIGDQQALAQSYLNLGNALASIDSFEKADEMYEKSAAAGHEIAMLDLCAQANYNRAYLHYLRGRYSDALQSFARLRQRFAHSGSRHSALCDLDEAEIYIQLNLSGEAAELAGRAAARFQELGLAYEKAKATAFCGVAWMQMQRYSVALEAFGRAQEIFQAEGNQYWIAVLDLYRAEVHICLDRLREAQALAAQAETAFDRLRIPSKRVLSLVLLSRVGLRLNDLSAADTCVNEISALIRYTKIPLVLFPYHTICAQIAERRLQWDEALRHYECAAQELEDHHARLHRDDLRVTFLEGRQHVYESLVRLSLDWMEPAKGLESAYAWCERARSRGLVELLSHYAPSIRTQAEQPLLAKVNQLREELSIQYSRLRPEAHPMPSVSSFESIAPKEQELARALRELASMHPEYASLQQVSVATLDTLRALLPNRTTLVEYFTAADEILAFVVSRGDARVVRHLCSAAEIVTLQERLAFQLEKFILGRDYVAARARQILESTNRHLLGLYQKLMAPVIHKIRTPHIAVVPHGTLHLLPFHAFYNGKTYAIDEYEFSYAPSASVLKYCLEKPDVVETASLLVGVVDENAPFVREEISVLNRLFPSSRVLRDQAATRRAFIDNSRASSFVHIATHAMFRQDNPMFSSFKLADGWITALDLFSMTCQTNLVALSGCQTGVSAVAGSDDLLGLVRGFLYAGARSMLVSLWNVNDESTTALMIRFYREWRQGAAKSAALRAAMLAVRETHPNPSDWAPFLLVGNP